MHAVGEDGIYSHIQLEQYECQSSLFSSASAFMYLLQMPYFYSGLFWSCDRKISLRLWFDCLCFHITLFIFVAVHHTTSKSRLFTLLLYNLTQIYLSLACWYFKIRENFSFSNTPSSTSFDANFIITNAGVINNCILLQHLDNKNPIDFMYSKAPTT